MFSDKAATILSQSVNAISIWEAIEQWTICLRKS